MKNAKTRLEGAVLNIHTTLSNIRQIKHIFDIMYETCFFNYLYDYNCIIALEYLPTKTRGPTPSSTKLDELFL